MLGMKFGDILLMVIVGKHIYHTNVVFNMNIHPGDILFVWGDSFIERAIEHVTHGAGHCAMFINENTVCDAMAFRTIGEQSLDYYIRIASKLEVWTDPTLTDDERKKMCAYAKKLYGEGYDYILIFLEFLHFETGINIDWYKKNDKFICATYINEIAKHVGRKWTDKVNPAPVDLTNYGALKRKYKIK
jgi:hypothetical protein